jgi:hypothetical protein
MLPQKFSAATTRRVPERDEPAADEASKAAENAATARTLRGVGRIHQTLPIIIPSIQTLSRAAIVKADAWADRE